MIKRIAVLTGGDNTPGMNAAIRAVIWTALNFNWEVIGVRLGFSGLIAGDFIPLTTQTVDGILNKGGTILGSRPCSEFMNKEVQQRGLDHLTEQGIDGLIVIGGDGSQAGAYALSKLGFMVNGVASSITNDVVGSDVNIGVESATHAAVEAMDCLKGSHLPSYDASLVEVAGGKYGYLALMTAIAGGADAVVVPEIEILPEQLADVIKKTLEFRGSQAIVVVAEGAAYNTTRLADHLETAHHFDVDIIRMSDIQRGCAPVTSDRILATRLGACAVEALAYGEHGVLAGMVSGELCTTPLKRVVDTPRLLDSNLLHLSALMMM